MWVVVELVLIPQHTECNDRDVEVAVGFGQLAHERVVGFGVGGVEVLDHDLQPVALEPFRLCFVGPPARQHERLGRCRQQLVDDRTADLARAAEQHDGLGSLSAFCMIPISS